MSERVPWLLWTTAGWSTPAADRRQDRCMSRLVVRNFSVSLDGYGAGPDQGPGNPIGVGGEALHEWLFRAGAVADERGEVGALHEPDPVDREFIAAASRNIGAVLMGRNMFGPVRGPWPDQSWTGWWGPEPPYHAEVFVLTHHPREPLPMAGSTTFHFVTEGLDAAVKRATAAAGGHDVLVAGGVSTLQQLLHAGRIAELDLVFVPVLLGRGERLFDRPIPYRCVRTVASSTVLHAHLEPTSTP
jgi:dihydrofolate reductase